MYEDCDVVTEEYVNVFGDPIELCLDSDNQAYVNLEDVRSMGFTIFKRSDYDMLRNIDRNIIVVKEFDLFMLSKASEYLLDRMITIIDNEDILETISRCRSKLGVGPPTPKDFQQRNRRSVANPYNNNISIRVDNQESRQRNPQQRNDGFNSHNRSDGFNNSQTRSDGYGNQNRSGGFGNQNRSAGFNSQRDHDSRQQNRGGNREGQSRSKSSNRNENNRSSFSEINNQMRPPRNLPSNFTPTQTQRFAGPSNSRLDVEGRFQKPADFKRQEQKRTTNETKESWDSDQKPENKRQQTRFDTQSQVSNSSGSSKTSLLKRLESVDTIDKVTLEVGQTYVVRITDLEKENICWVQETESCKNIDDLLLELDDFVAEADCILNPNKGQLCLAEYEGAWCRCRVIGTDPLNVLFIDYGNRADVKEVKELPQKFRKTPALACRLTFGSKNLVPLENDMELKIKVKQKYEDDTSLVEIEQKEEKKDTAKSELPAKTQAPAKQQQQDAKEPIKDTPVKCKSPQQEEKHYFDVPEPLAELRNGDKIKLIDVVDDKFAVKIQESIKKCAEITEYIKQLDKSELMLTSVKESQLVLCSRDGSPSLCRGIIKKKDSPTIVTVKYLDYSGEDQLSVKSLRNVDEFLAKMPCPMLYTPKLPVLSTLTEKSKGYLEELIATKPKMTVVITEDQDFDLQIGETFLSEKLLLLEKPKEEKSKAPTGPVTSTPDRSKAVDTEEKSKNQTADVKVATAKKEEAKTEVPVTYDDMPFFKADVGGTGLYICSNVSDVTELTLISMSEETSLHFEKVTLLETTDNTPFEPEVMDMCLVSYKAPEEEEPSWYRAVVLDKEAAGYAVSMVDFGTTATLKSKDIRRLPRDLKDVPILGILCMLKGVPSNEKCNARVKELLPETEEVTVKVLKYLEDELKYVIDIPDVTAKLKKEGLC